MGSLGELATETVTVQAVTWTKSRGAKDATYSAGASYLAAFKWMHPREIQAFGRDAATTMAWMLTDDRPDPATGTAPKIGDRVAYNGENYAVVAGSRLIAGLGESYWRTPIEIVD